MVMVGLLESYLVGLMIASATARVVVVVIVAIVVVPLVLIAPLVVPLGSVFGHFCVS